MTKPLPECSSCPLFQSPGPVWGSGSPGTRLVVIGGMPTQGDFKAGEVFSDQDGRYLENSLYRSGAQRPSLFLTNVVKCAGPGGPEPPPEAVRLCRPLLEKETGNLGKATTILTLGETAFKVVTGRTLVSRPSQTSKRNPRTWLRGCVDQVLTTRGPRWVIPTLQPRALREAMFTSGVWEWESDLRKTVRISNFGPVQPVESFNYKPTSQEIQDYVREILSRGEFGVDIETSEREVDDEERAGWSGGDVKIDVIGLSHSPGSAIGVGPEHFGLLKGLFTQHPKVSLYAFNWGYDGFHLQKIYGRINNHAHDEMLKFHTLYPSIKPLDLGNYLSLFTDLGYHKNLMHVAPDTYNARDTYGLLIGKVVTDRMLKAVGAERNYWDKMALVPVVGEMTSVGARCDLERARGMEKVVGEAKKHYVEVARNLLPEINLNAPAQLMTLFKGLGLPERKVRRKGKVKGEVLYTPSVNEEVLQEYADQYQCEWARLVILLRKLDNAGEFTKFYSEDGRVHTRYRIHGQAFGRIQTRDPNMQNIPKKIVGIKPREIVVADSPDDLLILCDFEQVDLWTYVYCTQDESLLEAKARGEYVYGFFWEESGMFSKPFFQPGKPRSKKYMNPEITDRELRGIKTGPLGLIYGRSWKGLQEGFGCSPAKAKAMFEKFHSDHPRIRQYHRTLLDMAGKRKYLIDLFGAIARFSNPTVMRNEILAFPGQSNAHGVQVHNLLLPLHRDLPQFGARLVLQVHDDVVVNVPKKHAVECMRFIEATATSPIKQMDGYSIPCMVTAGPSWGEQVGIEQVGKYL